MSFSKEFSKGLWKEIAPFRLVLGLCPVLAVTTNAGNGIGMGLATTFVLTFSNVLISLARKAIPKEVRIAAYIVVIATFTVAVELLTQAFVFTLYEALGMFIPLIVVNCIVLGRAEAFASKNGVVLSLADGLGIGLGFTASLAVLGGVRELLGAGTLLDGTGWIMSLIGPIFGSGAPESLMIRFLGPGSEPIAFMQQPPGAFVCLGILLAIMNILGSNKSGQSTQG